MSQSSTQITGVTQHSWFIKVIAIVLMISITLLWIPFPVMSTPIEQTVDNGVEVVDQMDGQNNFTSGKQHGQNTMQKLFTAFGK
jgi:hypothetical protein